MSRTWIEFADIRVGDTVEREHGGITSRLTVGERNSVAVWSDKDWALSAEVETPGDTARWFLLDRPTPTVELPETPQLGWLHTKDAEPMLGHWRDYTSTYRNLASSKPYRSALQSERDIEFEYVTAFTLAVAVPADALEKLRADEADAYRSSKDDRDRNYMRKEAIETFLAAIDDAGSRG